MTARNWTPTLAWHIPEGINLRDFEITYMSAQGMHKMILPAPSLNLAIRRFILLDMGALWLVRELRKEVVAC